ncbi:MULTISPECIES: GGDEF domain-containing protein [unclassified Marinitoga]|uniref:GGDEF domain-containing protein n=1 Tax=unclassified Marinitoga TaxID=2640159 RepID=UPI000640E1C5|nr:MULTISPECIES: GGDEF domain-containing protein [unclassified Marinitoga]KLO23693.1 hypothetical protein X274_05770 [Marinitoga sp. 1155]NUV00150.1 hypothetical protein [Marinitoga sp. 1154]
MNKKSIRTLLFNRSFIIVLLLSLITIIIIIFSVNIFFKKIYNSTIKQSVISVNGYFNSNLKYLDYYSVEYENIVKNFLDEVYVMYFNKNFSEKYNKLKSSYIKDKQFIKDINYYIINKNGVITETDYQKDLGLDISKRVPTFWKKLNTKLKENGEYIEKISFELKTNLPRIYGYKILNDGEIFEVGILLNDRAVPNFFKEISSVKFNFIEGIYVYNISYIPFSFESPFLDDEEKLIFDDIDYFNNSSNYIIREKFNGEKAFVYLKWGPDKDYTLTALTKIEIDFSELIKTKNYIIFISLLVTAIFLFVFTTYLYYNARKVEKPLQQLIRNIENGKIDEIETAIFEIDTLIKYYSHLLSGLVKKANEEEEEILNLKKKLENIEKEKNMLYDIALKDELTKLFNKKGAEKIFQRVISNNESFCVIYINLDNFKNVQKAFGENISNDLIKDFVEIVKKTIRDRDFIFRLSDDEFLILLRFVNIEISQKILKRLVEYVKKFNITTDKDYKISMSYGLLEHNGQDIEDIITDARKKMEDMKEKKKEILKRLRSNS